MLKYLLLFAATALGATAKPVDEIEALLHHVGSLQGAAFVRNGDAHTPTEAEAHLRLKWSKQKDDIVTAEDFIRLCGTQSSLSGKPYTIRFADGREEPAAQVLSKQLAKIREAVQLRPPLPSQATPAKSAGQT